MKTKLTLFLIVSLILIPLIFLGCKTQDTAELEGKLAEEENKIVQEEVAEIEEEEAPPAIYTDTKQIEEVAEEEVEEEDSNIEERSFTGTITKIIKGHYGTINTVEKLRKNHDNRNL